MNKNVFYELDQITSPLCWKILAIFSMALTQAAILKSLLIYLAVTIVFLTPPIIVSSNPDLTISNPLGPAINSFYLSLNSYKDILLGDISFSTFRNLNFEFSSH
jgi:hypothetical protein